MTGVAKDRHGTYYVRKKVPKRLEQAAALFLGNGRARQTFLKRSLGTKDLREANLLAKPVLIEFDKILAQAEALTARQPLRTTLEKREIEQITSYFYANELAADDADRADGGSERGFQDLARQLKEAGIEFDTPFKIGDPPQFGLSEREMQKRAAGYALTLPHAKRALARGDYSFLRWEIDELLKVFRINLDPQSAAYRELGLSTLRAYVKAIEAVELRDRGDVVDTPAVVEPASAGLAPRHAGAAAQSGGNEPLSAAYEGWEKSASRPANTLREFRYAVDRFIEFHGDIPVASINRSHVRLFREALQEMPLRRSGKLRTATLPQLVDWSKNAGAAGKQKVSAETINKLLGGVQAVCIWASNNGLIPDDAPWSDPFSKMRLQTRKPKREPWQLDELRLLFSSAIYTRGDRPEGGRGEAAFWLPLLALFTGARLNELAPLTASDVLTDAETGIVSINIREDEEQGRHLKTEGSARIVPVHPELVRMGFMKLVGVVKAAGGAEARLFPLLTPGPKGGFGEGFSQWFGRHRRDLGITNKASVFHSFRHGFKDAARAARVSEELHDALTGHSSSSVGRSYGAKDMVRRFGLETLADAVKSIRYPGLDLSGISWG